MLSKFIFNQANIYIFLWCSYYLQGILYPMGSIYSRLIFLLVISISLYNFIIVNYRYKLSFFLKSLNILLIMFTIYGVLLLLSSYNLPYGISKHVYLQEIYKSLLPLYSGFLYAKEGKLNWDSLSLWIPVWFLIAIASFFSYQQIVLENTNKLEITNNAGYDFLALIPVIAVVYRKKALFQFGGLLGCAFYLLLCMKRGPIVIAVLLFVIILFFIYKESTKRKKMYILFLIISLFIVISNIVFYMLDNSDYFVTRIEDTLEGNSSSRDYIYGIFWKHFKDEVNLLHFLFGHGASSTLLIGPNYAHNDWLEILINQGVTGIVVFVVFIYSFFKTIFMKHFDLWTRVGIGLSFIIVSMQTLFSMSYSNLSFYMTISLGFFLAQKKSIQFKPNNY